MFGPKKKSDDLFCGVVYIPPYDSRYASADPYYTEIQQEILRFCGNNKIDFNPRSKDLSDLTEVDGFISDVFGTENILSENACMYDYFEQNNVPFVRKSADSSVNQYGYNFIDFCKSNGLVILNGRIGNDYISPKLTCKNKCTVDYFVSSPFVFGSLDDVSVCDFSSLFSNAHSPVSLTLKNVFVDEPNNDKNSNQNEKRTLWNAEKSEIFVEILIFFAFQKLRLNSIKFLTKIWSQKLT